jgi:hypothetical protein
MPGRMRGRPGRGDAVLLPPKRLDLQPARGIEENWEGLPCHCHVGAKRDSKGHRMTRQG